MFEDLLRQWDGEHAVVRYDAASGTWIFVCIHSTRLGPAMGGTRLKTYDEPAQALEDGLRLAAGMTRKLAVLGLPCGGGKAVLAVPEVPSGDERRRLFERYADLIESLGGSYVTGPDVNTARGHGRDRRAHRRTSSAAASRTAARAIRASTPRSASSTASARRSRTRSDRTIRPAGRCSSRARAPSAPSSRGCCSTRARSCSSATSTRSARAPPAATPVAPDAALELECDVYAPCALGATLNADSIPRLRCRVVAGGANNQLATPADGERLRAAGILYAPDYVINGGGALHGIGLESLGWDAGRLEREVAGIGDTLTGIYRQADAAGITTSEAAERLAAERLAQP